MPKTVDTDKQSSRKKGVGRGRRADPEARAEVRELLGDMPRRRDLLIEQLHRLQDHFGHLSARHLTALSRESAISLAEIYEVATFYHSFDVVLDGEEQPPPITVRVCDSVTCAMHGGNDLLAALQPRFGSHVRTQREPCVGRCQRAPVAKVGSHSVEKANVDSVQAAVDAGRTDALHPEDIAYIDYGAYRSDGGYRIPQEISEGTRDPDSVIRILSEAGLRGLGGAGFPTGRKWDIVRNQPPPRYVAVNIDESEPGTFKDRHFLETDPHRFLEGALIAAKAVGAEAIYLYLRDEYPEARHILHHELERLQADPPCALPPIHLRRGAGAYICGEESAMLESIEGKRGMPRLRPPFAAQVGLWGQPTVENNLETLHWVRDVLAKGADWFTGFGRHGHTGLRAFAISGRVQQPGTYVAPAGITLRELLDEYAGGMAPGHELYGYLTGGVSGGILPESLADVPLDFDTLEEYGCFLGAAALVVFSTRDRARDLALNAQHFFADESCGKCTPCRAGTVKAAKLMARPAWDRQALEDLASVMGEASICGLGKAAPNPIRCVMRFFPEELGDGSEA